MDIIRSVLRLTPYKARPKTIPVHTLEPGEPKLVVSQNGYGVSRSRPVGGKNAKTAKKQPNGPNSHLLTSIGGCMMIHIPGSQEGVNVLAHLDPHIDHATALYRAVSHLVQEGIIEHPNGNRAYILTSPMSSPGAVQRAALALQAMGMRPEITRCIPYGGVAGINNQGHPVRFDFTDRSEYAEMVKTVGKKRQFIGPAREQRRLVYDNDNRFRGGYEPFEIYPKVPAMVYREGSASQPGAYGFNIPIDFELDESKLPNVEGVKVERKQTEHGQYVHVGASEKTGQLQPGTIKKVQKMFYAIVEQMAKAQK